MSLFPDLMLWETAALTNLSCSGGRMECDILRELGPPPDMILSLPPPPVPPSIEKLVVRLAAEADPQAGAAAHEDAPCHLCTWARGSSVGVVERAQKGPVIDDTWFFIIISSCVAAALLAIVLIIAYLKYRDKLKPLSDVVLAKKEKALGLDRCEAVLYPNPPARAPPLPPSDPHYSSKALWAGLKPLNDKFYTVDHCQPMNQKQAHMEIIQAMEDKYDYKHYAPANYSTLAPTYTSTEGNKSIVNGCMKPGIFENVGFVPGDEGDDEMLRRKCGVSRAALLLSRRTTLSRPPSSLSQPGHHYEMVSPRSSPASNKRHMSLGRNSRAGNGQHPLIISAPTNVPLVRLPPLNSRPGRYALTAFANGEHSLLRNHEDRVRCSQVALDRSGAPMTTLATVSPTDHVYASPITSPVI
ncbi:uncharacterized protein LOC108664420 isoform X2 [Hyalella azteca]|uniref:Uncharacterized protein LOC108664420 isoform X2 n=1 Tax=Hyalella azteca TaxID=294128 RepID=A0A8B7MYZ5_HYAAZ|nr:uncharacterized protein LOC108664420 isoform X2 [Hyalella azteca]